MRRSALPLPRMTTRRWMIAVAAVGVATWGTMMGLRANRLRRMATHAAIVVQWLRRDDAADIALRSRDDPYLLMPDGNRKMIVFWEARENKYSYAARYPWLPVEPDPPEP
jgi:hypothetical protein